MRPDDLFRDRSATRDIDDETYDERVEIEAPIEPVGEGSHVVGGVLAVLQRMKRSGQSCLQVAKNRIDPLELGQITGLEVAHNDWHVSAPGRRYPSEAAQPITGHDRAWLQVGDGPFLDRLCREAADQVELQMHGVSLSVDRNGCHERDLVLGATARFAAGALATEVGVIDLDQAAQPMGAFLSGHRAVDLLVQQPRGRVAHAQLTLERQRRQPRLGLADEVAGEEPCRQWQLRVLHQAARRQRGLVPATVALEELARTVTDDIVVGYATTRTTKAIWPAGLLDRFGALRLGAEAAQELSDRHAVLELDLVEGHGLRSAVSGPQLTAENALVGRWLRLVSNQVSG